MPDIKLEELNVEDRKALDGEIQLGQRICDFYLDRPWNGDLETIDRLFDLWLSDPRGKKPSANEVSLGLGSCLGEYLHARFHCRWVLVWEGKGCELGMICDDTEWQFFPRHWVAKRLSPENAGVGLFASVIEAFQEQGRLKPVAPPDNNGSP